MSWVLASKNLFQTNKKRKLNLAIAEIFSSVAAAVVLLIKALRFLKHKTNNE
jgi:hypothetical protein